MDADYIQKLFTSRPLISIIQRLGPPITLIDQQSNITALICHFKQQAWQPTADSAV